MVQQVRFMMFLLHMMDYPHVLPLTVHLKVFLLLILNFILLNLQKKAYHAFLAFGRIFTHGTEYNTYYLPCETL